MAVGGDVSLLDLDDLDDVRTELKQFPKSDWKNFGSGAGLSYNTLNEIQHNKPEVEDRFLECLSCWLRRKDNVDSKGKPSWRRLIEILEELDRALADKIRSRKGVSSDVHEEQQVGPAFSPIFLPSHLKEDYNKMSIEFGRILASFANQAFKNRIFRRKMLKEEIKKKMIYHWQSSNKEMATLRDEGDLMAFLRNHCSLWEFKVLTSLAEDANMTGITKELIQLEEKRKKLYGDILAEDFARSAIEYCGTTGSRKVTFEVTWPVDKATLQDFKKFLQDAFSRQDIYMYIQLSTVHNSLLTFVCVVPHWLVEEMKDYVRKNGDLFESKGVVEITVDGTIVFSVKHSLEPHQLSLDNEEKEKESLQQSEEVTKEKYMDQFYTQEDNRSSEGYACLIFYEKNSFIYFTAAPVKMLTALLEYIKDHHCFANIGPIHYFHFKWSNGFIELNFNEKPSAGWTVIPLIRPCRLYQKDIDSFDGTDGSIPPYCFISFQGSPDAVPTLHYPIPLVGVVDPVTLFIHRTKKTTAPPAAPYTGLVYHEKKEDQHLIIFTAARLKDISTAVTCIEDQYPLARINQMIGFDFDSNHDHIELILDAPQDQSITGWTIEPQSTKFLKDQFDRFSFTKDLLPSCLVSFHASPDAVPILHYSVPLEGVAETKTIDLLLKSAMTSSQVSYVGLIYYEWKGKKYLMTFTASKKLNHLLEYIEEYHPLAEIGQVYNFSFSPSSGFIELLLDDSCKGWTVQPLVEPCRLYQDDIDRFDEATYPLPPSCLVSIYGSPGAVSTLHYSVPLEGVADPVTLYIDRKLQLEKEVLELITSHEDTCTFKKDLHEKDRLIAESKKKLNESLEKHLILDKEKQELLDGISEICTLLKEQKQLESSKIFYYDVSKLEIILEPMEDLWYQLGDQLNVEVEEIQETTDTKEQMRSLLQLCSDKGVTILQLEEALKALDQKNLIPGLLELSKELEPYHMEEQPDEWKSMVANHISELLERKKQVEEQHFKEKQISKELKAKVADKELYITELEEEKLQAEEKKKILTEDIEKLKAKVADKELYITELEEEKLQAEEKKKILTEDIEKLKAKVADKELYITELEEEKSQAEERKKILTEDIEKLKFKGFELLEEKEQYLKEKQIITYDNQNLKAKISEKDEVIAKLTSQVEEQWQNERQIITDLKQKELYIAKLMKERQERVLKQPIKETSSIGIQSVNKTSSIGIQSVNKTSSIGLQWNYLISSMDKLDCLSDVQVAEKKLFLIQGDKPQLMNWEKYGLRIGVQEGSLLSSETVEAAVVALVGGEFQFPPNTVLVSTVYAVSLSKPLLKRLKLEIQHCIDLTGRPDLSRYLKFAIAPVSTPSLPYQFFIVEGGEFSSNNGYGFIKREEFSLVCILATEKSVSIGIPEVMTYAGMVYYEEEGVEDLVTFTATKKLNALLEFIRRKHSQAKLGQNVNFRIASPDGFVELDLNAPQDEPFTGWNIKPHIKPCRLYRKSIDQFGKEYYPLPPCCLISVYGSPDAVPTLHYSVPLEGVADPVAFYIRRSLRRTSPTTSFSSSTTITEATRLGAPATVDEVKKVIKDVLVSHYADLISLPTKSLTSLVNQLYTAKLISGAVRGNPSMEECIDEFKSSLSFKRKLPHVQEHCQKFISSFIAVGGPCVAAAMVLHEDWIEAIRNELGFDFNINDTASSTEKASPSATVDVNKVKKVIHDVLISHYADLMSLPIEAVFDLTSQLFSHNLVNNAVRENPSVEKFIDEFKAGLTFQRKLPQVEEHCQKFLNSLMAVRGSCVYAAIALAEDWIEAIRNELGFDFDINIYN